MHFSLRDVVPLLKESFTEWNGDNAMRHSAALAYYTVLSLAPLLILVIAVAGAFWPESGGAQQRLMNEISSLVGPESAGFIGEMLENAQRPGSGSLLATLIGVGTLLIGATAVFAQLQSSLNEIWEVKISPEYGIKGIIMSRVLSFGMILTIGFLLLISLVLTVVLSALSTFIGGGSSLEPLWQALNFVVSFGFIALLFAMMYRYLPDVEIAWRDTWVGAIATAFLFAVGKQAIGLYLGSSSIASSYGAAGSLVVLLVWVFYSASIFFFGAEMTQVFSRRFGAGIQPSKHAVRVIEKVETAEPEEAAALARHAGSDTPPPLPARRSHRRSFAKQALPFAAAFVVGRFTKRPKVKVVKRFIRS